MGVDAIEEVVAAGAGELGLRIGDEQIARLADYARLVIKWRKVANLTSAVTPEQFAREHVVDGLSILPFVRGPRVLDVGSGAGVPGVVLALARPSLAVTLLEPRTKRARFLTQARIELAIERLEVVAERAQTHVPGSPYDEIVARAFGAFAEFVMATRSFHAPGARLLAMKANIDPGEVEQAGLEPERVRVERLRVPGFRERSLVIVDFPGRGSGVGDGGEGV